MNGIHLHDETGASGIAGLLERNLLEDLASENLQAANGRITLTCRDGGTIVGGLDGHTSYGWLLVKVLWVLKERRREGIGRRLLSEAVRIACSRGCHAVWLDTSSRSTLDFYLSLGFTAFGTLSNVESGKPAQHRRWFLHRRIDG